MKKLILLLVVLASCGFAQDLYFSNDTISYGNSYKMSDITGDYYPFKTKLVNSSVDTVNIDSVVIDSLSNYYDSEDTVSLTTIEVGVEELFIKDKGVLKIDIRDEDRVIPPSVSKEKKFVHCGNPGSIELLYHFKEKVIWFWVNSTIYYSKSDGTKSSVKLVIGGYWFKEAPTDIKTSSNIKTLLFQQTTDKTPIYNARGQVISQNGSQLQGNLAKGVLFQKRVKFYAPSPQ